ncbi:MAG: hypothetical protein JNN29_05610, partial [Chitinophagaceae bacterium]|nr:hypothetical protein [Chitinophagaceae bacterium]
PLNEKGKRFSLDCKNPTVPLDEFLYHENRFATIKSSNPDMAGQFLNQANEGIKLHWERIEALKQL